MRYTIYIFIIAILISTIGFNSCTQPYGNDQLAVADSIIERYPDSAYKILLGIDKSRLRGSRNKTKYALLMSMALDKNYIDTTTFDIIQPAIDYYLKTGSPDEKLKTYYYQGVIYINRGEKDDALKSFMNGLENISDCKDSVMIARTLVAQGIIYMDYYDMETFVDNFIDAANIYHALYMYDQEINCLLGATLGYILIGDKERSDSILSLCENLNLKKFGESIESEYSALKLKSAIRFDSIEYIRESLNDNDSLRISDIDNALDIALGYNKLNDNAKAKQLLDYIQNSGHPFDTLKYYAINVYVCRDLEDYKGAYIMYREYSNRNDSINAIKFDQKARTAEDLHNLEMSEQNEKRQKTQILWVSVGCVVFLMLIIALLIILGRSNMQKKELAIERVRIKDLENAKLEAESEKLILEKEQLNLENKNLQLEKDKKTLEAENLANRIDFLEAESEKLKHIIEQQPNLPPEVEDAIKKRIEMLNSLLASYITDNASYGKAYEEWVKETTENSEAFMNSNRLAFQATHPKFIKYFEDHGLTTSEINYVCLYAIGLRGKEVGAYIKKRSHVNISSAIRKKLGIDVHETNLGIYVRKLLKSL